MHMHMLSSYISINVTKRPYGSTEGIESIVFAMFGFRCFIRHAVVACSLTHLMSYTGDIYTLV